MRLFAGDIVEWMGHRATVIYPLGHPCLSNRVGSLIFIAFHNPYMYAHDGNGFLKEPWKDSNGYFVPPENLQLISGAPRTPFEKSLRDYLDKELHA